MKFQNLSIFDNVSLNQKGYAKFKNGLIFQWGYNSGNTLTFPITFPKACFSLVATRYINTTYQGAIVHIASYSKTGASLQGALNDSEGGVSYNNAGNYFWFAIGI